MNTVAIECINSAYTVERKQNLFIVLINVKGALQYGELEYGRR
jgi:hypothetical protein